MTEAEYVPDQGDIVWVNLDPVIGHEQSGTRPVLVLTSRRYNGLTGLAIVCPITTKSKRYPFEVPLPPAHRVNGVVLVDQMKCLDWKHRGIRFFAAVPIDIVRQTIKRVQFLFEIS